MLYRKQTEDSGDLVLPDGRTPMFEEGQTVYAFEEECFAKVKKVRVERDEFIYTIRVREGFIIRYQDLAEFYLVGVIDGP